MNFFESRAVAIAIRLVLAGLCCLGIWFSWELVRADVLFQRDTPDSIRAAIRLAPDNSGYYMRLAQLDEQNARSLLEAALLHNPYNAQANIELGLSFEADGDNDRAEQLLLKAFSVDHTFLPRWTLANFYFRRDNMPKFWEWAQKSAQMPSDDVGPLFELCWRATHDAGTITNTILNNSRNLTLIRQYIYFLRTKNQLSAAGSVSERLVQYGDPEADSSGMLDLVNKLIESNQTAEAESLWSGLIEKQWVTAELTPPNNPAFARDPIPVRFDWALISSQEVRAVPGPTGLHVEFSGGQPETCSLADQAVVLKPGKYTVNFAYRSSDIAPDSGVHWEMVDAKSNTAIATSSDLSSESMQQSSFSFLVKPDSPLLYLRLAYQRPAGTERTAGTLIVQSIEIAPEH